jgi:hypothetical protein
MPGRKVRSAKGEMVDFDLLKIKEQIASEPAPLDVKARQDHVDQRLRRRLRKVKRTTPPAAPVAVEPKLPAAERAEQTEKLIDAPAATEEKAPVTKQKARSKKKKTT